VVTSGVGAGDGVSSPKADGAIVWINPTVSAKPKKVRRTALKFRVCIIPPRYPHNGCPPTSFAKSYHRAVGIAGVLGKYEWLTALRAEIDDEQQRQSSLWRLL
jgi:hypothetical protein